MSTPNGALRIFLYNWPIYFSTWLGAAAVTTGAFWAPPGVRAWLWVGCAGAVTWSAVSLGASHYIYDLSELPAGTWIRALAPECAGPWVSIDAGVDPSIDLQVLPTGLAARFDVYRGGKVGAGSVERARGLATSLAGALPASASDLPLRTHSCAAVVLAFTAHEIRDPALRDRFFAEVRRVLKPGGRALLVEHLRDLQNFLVFGPGFLHFEPKSEWLRAAHAAGLTVELQRSVTPWIVALALGSGP